MPIFLVIVIVIVNYQTLLVVNVVGELQRKRTLAASRDFLAAAWLSCFLKLLLIANNRTNACTPHLWNQLPSSFRDFRQPHVFTLLLVHHILRISPHHRVVTMRRSLWCRDRDFSATNPRRDETFIENNVSRRSVETFEPWLTIQLQLYNVIMCRPHTLWVCIHVVTVIQTIGLPVLDRLSIHCHVVLAIIQA